MSELNALQALREGSQRMRSLSYGQISGTMSFSERMNRARYREYFYQGNTYAIQQILKHDLLLYMAGADINRLRLITQDEFFAAFLQKLCNVYNRMPVFIFENATDDQKEAIRNIFEEVNLPAVLSEQHERTRLHNTIMSGVKYNEGLDRLWVDFSISPANTYVEPEPGFPTIWRAMATYLGVKDNRNWYVVWDRARMEHYYLITEKSPPEYSAANGFVGTKTPIAGNPDIYAPEIGGEDDFGLTPWVVYRHREHPGEFWGFGLDAIVELVRIINILFTVAADDTAQETIRLLILNFEPSGTASDAGHFKGGMRHPIWDESKAPGSDPPTGEVVKTDLYTDEIINLIEKLVEVASSLHNVPTPLRHKLEQDLSGIALQVKAEPMMRQWAEDVTRRRNMDRELIRALFAMANYYRDDIPDLPLELVDEMKADYREPDVVTDEKAEYELRRKKWEDGTESILDYVVGKNPELAGKSEDEVIEYIRQNKEIFNQITGIIGGLGLGDISNEEE